MLPGIPALSVEMNQSKMPEKPLSATKLPAKTRIKLKVVVVPSLKSSETFPSRIDVPCRVQWRAVAVDDCLGWTMRMPKAK